MANKWQRVPAAAAITFLDMALTTEPLRMALWDAGMPCTLCHALHVSWREDMQPAAAAAKWLAGSSSSDLATLMQQVAGAGRLDVAAALLASSTWDGQQCIEKLAAWAKDGHADLCYLLLTR